MLLHCNTCFSVITSGLHRYRVFLFVSLMNLSATAEKGKHNLTNKEKPHRLREFAPRSVQNSNPASFSHLFRPNKNLCCDCF